MLETSSVYTQFMCVHVVKLSEPVYSSYSCNRLTEWMMDSVTVTIATRANASIGLLRIRHVEYSCRLFHQRSFCRIAYSNLVLPGVLSLDSAPSITRIAHINSL